MIANIPCHSVQKLTQKFLRKNSIKSKAQQIEQSKLLGIALGIQKAREHKSNMILLKEVDYGLTEKDATTIGEKKDDSPSVNFDDVWEEIKKQEKKEKEGSIGFAE